MKTPKVNTVSHDPNPDSSCHLTVAAEDLAFLMVMSIFKMQKHAQSKLDTMKAAMVN